MKSFNSNVNSDAAAVAAINAELLRTGCKDYIAHTDTHGAIDDISDAFIERLAYDSAVAKADLREVFRRCPNWCEETQRFYINGTTTHNPDYLHLHELACKLMAPAFQKANDNDWFWLNDAMKFFTAENGTENVDYQNALKKLAPQAFKSTRKLSRRFRKFLEEIGIDVDGDADNRKWFAEFADELNGCKIDFRLYVSINPSDFITMSNPVGDNRGSMLTSCHSFNDDTHYNSGCTGYARDDITFIVFVVKDPDKPELLNNRKIWRQLFMYRINSGILLQSRLYGTSGGTYGAQSRGALFRDLVQRAISKAEGAVNSWLTMNYDTNKYGIKFYEGEGFQGYADWIQFSGEVIKLSVRKDKIDAIESGDARKVFTVGTYGLCVSCGEEICDSSQYCEDCDPENRMQCDYCGNHFDEEEMHPVIDAYGNEVYVCEDCRDEFYTYCDCCHRYHLHDEMTTVASGDWICSECLERDYTQCDECGEWIHNDDRYYAYRNGEEVCICLNCLECCYSQCTHCEECFHNDEVTYITVDGYEECLCGDCEEYLRGEGRIADDDDSDNSDDDDNSDIATYTDDDDDDRITAR